MAVSNRTISADLDSPEKDDFAHTERLQALLPGPTHHSQKFNGFSIVFEV